MPAYQDGSDLQAWEKEAALSDFRLCRSKKTRVKTLKKQKTFKSNYDLVAK